MARKIRTHITSDTPTDGKLTPKHLTKAQFGKRLYTLMLTKGWNQSELARQAGLPRDSVSVYIRGKSLPTPANLKQLANALGTVPEELLPNHLESAIDEDNPSLEMRVSTNAPNLAWLRVNRLVTTRTAVKVIELLEDDDALDRTRGSNTSSVQPVED